MAIFVRSDWLPYLRISLDIHCFGTGFKMASHFATVSKDEILAENEAAAPTNTKKREKIWFVAVYWSVEKTFNSH